MPSFHTLCRKIFITPKEPLSWYVRKVFQKTDISHLVFRKILLTYSMNDAYKRCSIDTFVHIPQHYPRSTFSETDGKFLSKSSTTSYKKVKLALYIREDILGNLRVKISDPWRKNAPRNIFEILFWLETSKNDHSRRGGSTLVLRSMCPSTSKNALLFLELPFYFPEVPFGLLEMSFRFPEVPVCFPEVPFCFPEMLFFLKNALLFSRTNQSY